MAADSGGHALAGVVTGAVAAALALFAAIMLASCGPSDARQGPRGDQGDRGDQGPRVQRVVTTTAHLADLVRVITGRRYGVGFVVEALMGEGVDPHTFKLTQSDTAKLTRADLILVNGLHLEGKMDEVLEQLARAGRRVVRLGERLRPEQVFSPEGAGGEPDPHFWMDPTAWSTAALAVERELSTLDPDGSQDYRINAKDYMGELLELDRYAGEVLSSIEESRRILITSHDAFGYLGRRYGLRVLGVQGLSTDSEAGVRDIARLVETIVSARVPAVFVETSVSDKAVRALVEGARARGHTVEIGGALFSDALGAPGTWEGTYLGMMDHNLSTIARALGGTVPEGGYRRLWLERRKP
jgi:manganese/zinc/iron transport system substrate-binding protein